MPIKKRKNENFEKKIRFFLMSQGSLNPKIRFLGQKVCPVGCSHTDGRTDGHTDRVTTVGTLSEFQDFILQPIIKGRPNCSTVCPIPNPARGTCIVFLQNVSSSKSYFFICQAKSPLPQNLENQIVIPCFLCALVAFLHKNILLTKYWTVIID